jgi:phage-related protein (TIGR01555 family)
VLVPSIDGQDPATPLRAETVGMGQLRGFDVYDRWRIVPDYATRLSKPGRDRGLFEFYSLIGDGAGTPSMRIHYSRIIRYDAAPLPYRERLGNSMWGMSIIERLYPIIRAHDTTVMATAQLVLRAHLRVLKIPGLFDARAGNSVAWSAIQKRLDDMRLFQSSENITVIDGEEMMEQLTPVFSGLDKILEQQANQVCGAIEIPEVRVFRRSASGLNASDEWALNCYYDDVNTRQRNTLTGPVVRLYDLISRSATGEGLPLDFAPEFRHLSKPNPEKRATVATATTGAILQAYDAGLITPKCALLELKQASADTGIFSNITDEDIAEAEDMPPKAELAVPPQEGEDGNVIDLDSRRVAQ